TGSSASHHLRHSMAPQYLTYARRSRGRAARPIRTRAVTVTSFSVMGLFVAWGGLFVAWGLVQIWSRRRLIDCNVAASVPLGIRAMNRLRQWRLVGSAVGGERHFWLEQLIFGLDGVLRRWQSVVEYTHDPACILRIKLGRLDQDFALSDGTVGHAGARFIDLHLWNEQVPAMPKEGASIAWARQMSLCFKHSLRQLARYLAARADLDNIS